MVVLGVDAHKRSHVVVGVDGQGRRLAEHTAATNDAGVLAMLDWARSTWPEPADERLWAVEDCRHVTGRLERLLLNAGEHIVRVPPARTAAGRRARPGRGKTDAIDALAVARAALADPDLPVAGTDPIAHELRLLTAHRDHLVADRTRTINRLRWLLHDLDPDLIIPARRLPAACHLATIATALTAHTTLTATIATTLLNDITRLNTAIKTVTTDITTRVNTHAPALLNIPGCGHLTAAKIVAETAGITRFATPDRYAAYTGTAPIPASSGTTTRHRLHRGGNRQLNAAIHRIALTQTRLPGPGRDYYHRRRTHGKTPREALRALKRQLIRTLWHALHQPTPTNPLT